MNRYSVIVLSVLVCGFIELGLCREGNFIQMRPGGVYDYGGNQNSAEIEGLARFAVQEHNKKEVLSVFSIFSSFCFTDSS